MSGIIIFLQQGAQAVCKLLVTDWVYINLSDRSIWCKGDASPQLPWPETNNKTVDDAPAGESDEES